MVLASGCSGAGLGAGMACAKKNPPSRGERENKEGMTRGMLAFARFAEMRGRPGKFRFRYSRIAFIIQT